MYLAEFAASSEEIQPATDVDIAFVGTHDTATFAGWIAGADIEERIRHGLLADADAPAARAERDRSSRRLADMLGCDRDDPSVFLERILAWLGASASPLVNVWLEDLWLEPEAVNLPGTTSSDRPNWQRPMKRLLDQVIGDPEIERTLRRLADARRG